MLKLSDFCLPGIAARSKVSVMSGAEGSVAVLACVMFLASSFGSIQADDEVSGDKPNQRSDSSQLDDQKENYDAHRSYVTFHFKDQEMDFAFEWILGSIPYGGCEVGEAFYTASRIEDGNPESWQTEWRRMAERKVKRAEDCLKGGHRASARNEFLKASNYYRAALISMLPDNPRFGEMAEKSREYLKKGGALFDPPVEYIEIPFENTVMPGYFIKAAADKKKRKTLIMIGGGETLAEDLYFYIAPGAIERGYNFMTVDLPGQGMLPAEGLFFRADTEVPMKAVLDYALSRSDVDPEKVAAYGISNGGYFVPRAATVLKDIKAVVVCSAIVDNYRMFAQMPFAKDSQEQIDAWPEFKRCVTSAVTWRWGLDPSDIKGQVEKNVGYQFDPSEVTCPFLDLIGEGEYANEESKRQQQECMEALPNPVKKFVITPTDEGASSHCVGENRTVMSQVVFDWLDEVFGKNSNEK